MSGTSPGGLLLDPTLIVYGVNVILALWIVFLERKKPSAVFTWILVLFFIPWAGFALYIIFGRRPSLWKGRSRTMAKEDREATHRYLERSDLSGLRGAYDDSDQTLREHASLVRLLDENGALLSYGNRLEILTDGHALFERMFEDIRNARDHVHVEFFIIRNDDLGVRFLDLLTQKAREGVEVRVLFDDVGGRPSQLKLLDLERAGGAYERFFPSPVPLLRWLNVNINYRNHRKIVVIDGRVSYVGGFNVGDEYLGKDPDLGYWRDTHLRVDGPASLALQLRFLLDWNFASDRRLEPAGRYFPPTPGRDGAAVQVVSSGPMRRQDQIKEAYLKMIASAKRSILIQTPYFIPDQSVMDLLRISALSGVGVKIMVPMRRDQMLVHWASDSYLGELLPVGVRVFYYTGGFLHSKTLTVDDSLVSIGSANWDIRGFELNFETNAVVYDRDVVSEHIRRFERDLGDCVEMTKESYDSRGLVRRVKESVSRLASPVL